MNFNNALRLLAVAVALLFGYIAFNEREDTTLCVIALIALFTVGRLMGSIESRGLSLLSRLYPNNKIFKVLAEYHDSKMTYLVVRSTGNETEGRYDRETTLIRLVGTGFEIKVGNLYCFNKLGVFVSAK